MKFTKISKKDIILLKRAALYIKPYKIKFLLLMISILGGVAFGLIQPLLWAQIIAKLFARNFYAIPRLVLYLLIFYIIEGIIRYIQTHLTAYINENIVFDIKRDLFNKILGLPIKAFDEMRVGEFISRLQGDAATISNILTNQFLKIITDLLKVFIVGIALFSISWPLSLVVLAEFPLSLAVFSKFGNILRDKNTRLSVLTDCYISKIQESILGIREVKGLGIKGYSYTTFLNIGLDIKIKKILINVLVGLSQILCRGINFIHQIVIISFGGYLIFKNILSIELFIAFTSYSGEFSGSLNNITMLSSDLQQALTSLERIFNLMDNFNYSKEKFGTKEIEDISGCIDFQNVSFGYEENMLVLKDFSMQFDCNKKIAIVGYSGCGKSTIFSLLMRFYEPLKGNILIDNINIKDFDEISLRKHLSVVRQEPFLFNLSILYKLI